MKKVLFFICFVFSLTGCNSGDDEGLAVTVYKPGKAYDGTTFFSNGVDNTAVEIDMKGIVLWKFDASDLFVTDEVVGFEAERLDNGHVLLTLSGSGLYEIDRNGSVVWSYQDPKVSHDADVLDNDNILYNYGSNDQVGESSVKEITRGGETVWEWSAADYLLERFPPQQYSEGGWVHSNAVQRLSDNTTMISLRNFWLTVIVDKQGDIVAEYDWSRYGECYPHEAQVYEKENALMVCLQNDSPYAAVKIDMDTQEVLWTYPAEGLRTTRDCDILPNGNVLLTTVDTGSNTDESAMSDDYSKLIEVTSDGEIVWELEQAGTPADHTPGWFFKAERFGPDGKRAGTD